MKGNVRILLPAALLTALSALGALPTAVTYRGRVAGDDERTVTEPMTVRLAFYTNRTDGAAAFAVTNGVQPTQNGVFSITATGEGIDRLAAADALNYVGVTAWTNGVPVGGGEIVPRQVLLPQPYASEAEFADRLASEGAVKAVTAFGELSCRTFAAAAGTEVRITNALVAATLADGSPCAIGGNWSARKVDVRVPRGVSVFSDWVVFGDEWWKADWPELVPDETGRGRQPTANTSLTLTRRGAYFFSSLGQKAGEEGRLASAPDAYASLNALRTRIWCLPGLTVLSHGNDRIEGAATTVFQWNYMESSGFTDHYVPPLLTVACLLFNADGEGARE